MAEDLWAAADLVTPMAVRVAATLRLADHLQAGLRTPEVLAAATGTHPDALARLMAYLVTAGILTPSHELTVLGEQLRDDHPGGARAWLDLDGALGHAELSFVELLHSIRTGEPGYQRHHGRPFWDDLAADPARQASFDALMGARLTGDLPAVATAYPWGGLGHVVDVGGGSGDLLIAILAAHPGLHGTVVDRPGPAARAERAFAGAGLSDRARVHPGSFFDPLPPGDSPPLADNCPFGGGPPPDDVPPPSDTPPFAGNSPIGGSPPSGGGVPAGDLLPTGYVLSGILHDWGDEDATAILRRCAETGGTVVLVDHFGLEHTSGDLRMLCFVGGRERTLDQVTALAAAVGLRRGSVRPAGSRTIVDFSPAGRRTVPS